MRQLSVFTVILFLLMACSRSSPVPESTSTAARPVCQPSPILKSSNSFPEIQGTMKSEGELWALLFFDGATSNTDLKFAWRIASSGAGIDFHAQAHNENGKIILPIWGPEYHGGSSWQRPGIEWGTGFNFPEPGCWTITITSGASTGEIYLDVMAP